MFNKKLLFIFYSSASSRLMFNCKKYVLLFIKTQ